MATFPLQVLTFPSARCSTTTTTTTTNLDLVHHKFRLFTYSQFQNCFCGLWRLVYLQQVMRSACPISGVGGRGDSSRISYLHRLKVISNALHLSNSTVLHPEMPFLYRKLRIWCGLGLVLSFYATYVELRSEKDSGYRALCDWSSSISCTRVFNSVYFINN